MNSSDLKIEFPEKLVKQAIEQGCKRLFYGRCDSDLLELNIDYYSGLIIIVGYEHLENQFLVQLTKQLLTTNLPIRSIYYQDRTNKHSKWELLYGDSCLEHICTEGNIKYLLKLGKNRNPGIFLDSAHLRMKLALIANEKICLNLFSFTGSYTVSLISGGAKRVDSYDMNQNFHSWCRETLSLNGFNNKKAFFKKANIMKSMGFIGKRGPFDIIILDPPTDQGASFNWKKDYAKILRRLENWLADDGVAFVMLNATNVSLSEFREFVLRESGLKFVATVDSAFANSDRELKIIELASLSESEAI